jgi:glutamate/tyrosine decarboxylase-like PLP-dependent enzyme
MAAAVYRNGLEGMQAMMQDNPDRELPDQIVAMLQDLIEAPPKEVKGVSDDFLAGTSMGCMRGANCLHARWQIWTACPKSRSRSPIPALSAAYHFLKVRNWPIVPFVSLTCTR